MSILRQLLRCVYVHMTTNLFSPECDEPGRAGMRRAAKRVRSRCLRLSVSESHAASDPTVRPTVLGRMGAPYIATRHRPAAVTCHRNQFLLATHCKQVLFSVCQDL